MPKLSQSTEEVVDGFEPGPAFSRLRTIAFSCIMIVSFVWTVLLFVELYLRWTVSDSLQRGMVVVLSVINAGTVILLIVLIILPFRVWLDTARLALLIVAHGGTAVGFTIWSPKFTCPSATTTDEDATCRLLNLYILLGSWVVPGLLLVYAACLSTAYTVYRKRMDAAATGQYIDEEKAAASRGSVLPFMHPPTSSGAPTPTTTHFLGPLHQSLPPPGPIYPSGPPPVPIYPFGPPTGLIYPSGPPGPKSPSGLSPTDRRMSINPHLSVGDASASKRTSSRPSQHISLAASVVSVPPLAAMADERRRKDSLVSLSEYSQSSGSRSSGRVTLTKPIPLSKLENAF